MWTSSIQCTMVQLVNRLSPAPNQETLLRTANAVVPKPSPVSFPRPIQEIPARSVSTASVSTATVLQLPFHRSRLAPLLLLAARPLEFKPAPLLVRRMS
jgi:hypothetical protein